MKHKFMAALIAVLSIAGIRTGIVLRNMQDERTKEHDAALIAQVEAVSKFRAIHANVERSPTPTPTPYPGTMHVTMKLGRYGPDTIARILEALRPQK